jgi:hypothetical protein
MSSPAHEQLAGVPPLRVSTSQQRRSLGLVQGIHERECLRCRLWDDPIEAWPEFVTRMSNDVVGAAARGYLGSHTGTRGAIRQSPGGIMDSHLTFVHAEARYPLGGLSRGRRLAIGLLGSVATSNSSC